MSLVSFRRYRHALLPWMLGALLLTQGLRLCLHDAHLGEQGNTHVAAVHVESDLTAPSNADDGSGKQHVPLLPLLVKKLVLTLALALPGAPLLLLLPRVIGPRLAWPGAVAVPRAVDDHLRPPLRAPPR